MRAHSTSSSAGRRLYALVGVRWQRWQCRVAAFYAQHVMLPVEFWRALGAPATLRPQLPWWQPFVWHYLHLTGWVRASRRRERPV